MAPTSADPRAKTGLQDRIEHELHGRRKGRNTGVGLLLTALVVIVLGLTVVKVTHLQNIRQFESFDHVLRPALEVPAAEAGADAGTEVSQ